MLRRFQLEELVKATNNFSQECLLGSGGFGNVYKGTFDVEGTLAIKRAHSDSYQSLEEFRNGKTSTCTRKPVQVSKICSTLGEKAFCFWY